MSGDAFRNLGSGDSCSLADDCLRMIDQNRVAGHRGRARDRNPWIFDKRDVSRGNRCRRPPTLHEQVRRDACPTSICASKRIRQRAAAC